MTRSLALANTVLQIALIVAALTAFYLARKRRLKIHCLIMRVTVAAQIILIAAIMTPSLAAYLRHWDGWSSLMTQIVIHHVLGVVVVLLFIYFNLVMTGVVKMRHRLRPYMRTALVLWLVSLAMGLYLYVHVWT